MKKLLVLPFAAVVAFAACGEQEPFGPERPQFELVSGGMDRADANIEIVASFTHTITGGTAYRTVGSPGINAEGKEIGICEEGGAWRNPAGKLTGARPHSHCVTVGSELTISLEPISGTHEIYCFAACGNPTNRRLADKVVFNAAADMLVEYDKESGNSANWFMNATGVIVAHAIDQHGNRHGTFTFNLNQFHGGIADLFDAEVNIGTEEEPVYVWGLDRAINATYTAPGGAQTTVQGWIYWDEIE
jgi:hypothetical protein